MCCANGVFASRHPVLVLFVIVADKSGLCCLERKGEAEHLSVVSPWSKAKPSETFFLFSPVLFVFHFLGI